MSQSIAEPTQAQAIERRVQSGLELVDVIAAQVRKTSGGRVDYEELVAAGREGLVLAARRFDPERGVPFPGYAGFRIRGAMLDAMRRSGLLPRRVHQSLRAAQAGIEFGEDAAADTTPPVTGAEAERRLDDHLAGMATAMALGVVAERALGDDGQAVARDPEVPVDDRLATQQLLRLVVAALDDLPAAEGTLVRRHYLEGERFDVVAQELGLSKSWASRLHTRAIARLTARFQADAEEAPPASP